MKNQKTKTIKNLKINKIAHDLSLTTPIHPWRLCPYGEHWIRTHELHIPPNKKSPNGSLTIRHEHCARNPSGKDQHYPDEIQEIAQKNFGMVLMEI